MNFVTTGVTVLVGTTATVRLPVLAAVGIGDHITPSLELTGVTFIVAVPVSFNTDAVSVMVPYPETGATTTESVLVIVL